MKRFWLARLLAVIVVVGSALLVNKQIIAAPAMSHPAGCCRHVHSLTPRRMVARYFAALNAYHFYAAWKLEAPCGVTFSISNGPGAPVGSAGYPRRGAWLPVPTAQARHPILASAHVTTITRLHIPILTRNHILAFGVSGWYRFDYSRVPWANMKHKNGFHVVKIAVWRCHGRWGVEPQVWLVGSGGELNWT